ncbi:MAG TPA: sensor histidine kinase [Candidatus Acidoferrales bacterium]|jgi:two-component sensor histidine kinase|nr:sensor histidine kinase [Candidatus Acidoferrales bacterium]
MMAPAPLDLASAPLGWSIEDDAPGAEDYAKALINILEDFADERLRHKECQAAVMNILEDAGMEKLQLEDTQRAALNILADFGAEQGHFQNVQKAIFNILDDLHAEKGRLEAAQAELIRSRKEVQSSLREKEVLLQEVHHRVKNNLQVISSLINMQVRRLRDVSSRDALEECQNRVQAIALIHEKLYQSGDYARVPFSDYARSLAANIFHATGISPENTELSIEFETLSLPVDKAIPCGLILNELITNSLKHAFPNGRPGTVRVQLRATGDGEIELLVGDDGVGMDTGFNIATSNSLGMQLVQTLVEQLEGQLDILHEGGTAFRIKFPLEGTK